MGRFKKRTGVAMLTLAMVVLPAMAVQAATMGTFEEVSQQYEESAANYIYDITASGEQVQEVILFASKKGVTFTETHIREEASASSQSVAVLPKDTTVVVWGMTSNGWTKVFCETVESGPLSGYIRSDLLNEAK